MATDTISDVQPYLTFRLGEEVFAFDVAAVREVLDFSTITKIPRTPEYMRGVINLRGSVVPVLDLRLAFNMTRTEKTVNTCIIVVEVALDNEHLVIGALADSVEEVIEMEPDQIQPAPKLGASVRTDFVRGMGRRDSEFIMILDIDKVFGSGELELLKQLKEQ
jgi:purine-binding chemotaxis protein CheW